MLYGVNYENQFRPVVRWGHLNLGEKNKTEKITVNSRYFLKNDKPWIPVMGEIHYTRIQREYWERELLKMKAGGITVVSCYVIWIYHEEKEGIFDFTGNRDLRAFLSLVQSCGMKAVLRIGPWVHGEVRNGGFPNWLLEKKCVLRKNNVEYLSYVKKYFEKISCQVRGYLFSEGGPIWAIQLENELTNEADHLLTLRHLAEEVGLKVPVYTVTGWNAKYGAEIPEWDVVPVFGGYPEAPWENHTKKLEPNSNYFFLPARNDSSIGKDLLVDTDDRENVFHMNYDLYPFATCELGGGMQVTHHRRPIMGEDDVASLALVKLGCGNNMPGYYMYHGGTNGISLTTLQESKETGYPNDYTILNYDFQAPIGEFGQIRKSYHRLKLQHIFLQRFMEILAPMEAYFQKREVTGRQDKENLRYAVRTDGKGGFVFVNNFQRQDTLAAHSDVQFQVPCCDGQLIFPRKGMRVDSGSYFILPYYLDLNGTLLRYSTAQLLYQKENTWFFFAPFGMEAEFCIGDLYTEPKIFRVIPGKKNVIELLGKQKEKIQIVVLNQEEADHFYVLGEEVYVSEGAELYQKKERIFTCRCGSSDLSYWKWEESLFTYHSVLEKEQETVEVSVKEFQPYLPDYAYISELFLDGRKEVQGYICNITEDMLEGLADRMLHIFYGGDVLQIYIDGILVADDFNKGIPYEISLAYLLKFGSCMEILISEMKEEGIYLENEAARGNTLNKIQALPVYTK